MKVRKPIALNNGGFVVDGNFNKQYFTLNQAKKYAKDYKKRLENGFTNGFKFSFCNVIERENYFSISLG